MAVGTKLAVIGSGAEAPAGGAAAAAAQAGSAGTEEVEAPAADDRDGRGGHDGQDGAPAPAARLAGPTPAPGASAAAASPAPAKPPSGGLPRRAPARRTKPTERAGAQGGPSKLLSPVVRRLIAEHGLDPAQIAGTGAGGRITRDDVLAAIEYQGANGDAAGPASSAATAAAEGRAPARSRLHRWTGPAGRTAARPRPRRPPAGCATR